MVRRERQYRYIIEVCLGVVLILITLIVVPGQTEEEVRKREAVVEKLLAEANELYNLSSIDEDKKYDAFLKLREAFTLLKGWGSSSKEAIICVEMGKMFDQQEPKDASSIEFYEHAAEVFDKLGLYFEEAKVYRLMQKKCVNIISDHYDSLEYMRRANKLEHEHINDFPAVERLSLVKKIYIDPVGEDDWSKEFRVILKNEIVNILHIVEFRDDQADAVFRVEKGKESDFCLINRKGEILWKLKNFRNNKQADLAVKSVIDSLVAEINKEKSKRFHKSGRP